ncbi:MAG: hypothetical protein IK084_06005 [Bacteroidaceae bacterium]|nr:hypothetical protein [Bacteroidaceae bacterium]
MRHYTLLIYLLLPFLLYAQYEEEDVEDVEDLEHYEIVGAKLGRKITRQVITGNFERTPTINSIQPLFPWDIGYSSGYHRPLSFVGAMDGVVMGTLAHKYGYQNYYHGSRQFNYRKKLSNSTDISALDVVNITYADDDGDGMLGKDETAQVYFDLINTGDTPLYGITPVILAYKTKHIILSEPCVIDTLNAQSALRYVIELSGDGKRNSSNAYLLLRVNYGQQQHADIMEIFLGTKRRKE